MNVLSIASIEQAARFLDQQIEHTPVEYSPKLSELLGVPVYLKLEFLQKTGSFKFRGALWRLHNLTDDERNRGVITCSAGNHGKALACAAKQLGINVTVFVPRDVDQVKYEGIRYYGAEVIRTEHIGYDESKHEAHVFAEKTGQTFVSAYDDPAIMAGNGGTLAKEVLEQVSEARNFILPVGGGGLSAGFSLYSKEKFPDSTIIACQLLESPALKLSLEQDKAVTELPAIKTVAGGIEGGIGEHCFEYLRKRVDQVVLIKEDEIINGFQWMLQNHQYLIEPSAAVTVSACLSGRIKNLDKPVVVVLSGKNVSYPTIQELICHPQDYLRNRSKSE